jgi:protein N-terminal amidase
MDLNPQIDNWRLSEAPYELASHCISNKANVLILLNAWLDSEKDQNEAYDWSTLNYWAARLQPLWANDEENRSDDHDSESEEPPTLRPTASMNPN